MIFYWNSLVALWLLILGAFLARTCCLGTRRAVGSSTLFMARIQEPAAIESRRQKFQRLEGLLEGMRKLLTELRKDDALTWDLQLQATKELAEVLLGTFPACAPETRTRGAFYLRDLLSPWMERAEQELRKHLRLHSQQKEKSMPWIRELARLAICGHRVCWHRSHVLRSLSSSTMQRLAALAHNTPGDVQLNDLMALASGKVIDDGQIRFVVNRDGLTRAIDIRPPATFKRHVKTPDVAVERAITHRLLRLPNGLKVLLCSDPSVEADEVALQVDVGYHHDKDIAGLAHLAEHLIMRQRDDQFIDFVELHGRPYNGETKGMSTTFWYKIGSNQLEPSLQLFGELFLAPTTTADLIKQEIDIIQLEAASKMNSLHSQVWHCLRLSLNPDHPEGSFPMGTKHTLAVPQIETRLRSFYATHYTANKMTLVVRSQRALCQLERLVSRHFKYIPRTLSLRHEPRHNVPLKSSTLAGSYIRVYNWNWNGILFQWFGVKHGQEDCLLQPLFGSFFEIVGITFPLPHHLYIKVVGNGDLLVNVVFFTSKTTLHSVPDLLAQVQQTLAQAAAGPKHIVGTNGFVPDEFTKVAAAMLARRSLSNAIDIPYMAKYGPVLDVKTTTRLWKIIRQLSTITPHVSLLTRDSPPHAMLPRTPLHGYPFGLRPYGELVRSARLLDTRHVMKPVHSKLQLLLEVPRVVTSSSKAIFLGELVRRVARTHNMDAIYLWSNHSRVVELTLFGTPCSPWSQLLSNVLTIFTESHSSHAILESLMPRAAASAQHILKCNLQEEQLLILASSYVEDILTMPSKKSSWMTDPNPGEVTYQETLQLALSLVNYGEIKLHFEGTFNVCTQKLVEYFSDAVGIPMSRVSAEVTTYVGGLKTRSPWSYYQLPPGIPLFYIPPGIPRRDSALVAFFQLPPMHATIMSVDGLLIALQRLCQAHLFINLRRRLQVSYSPHVERHSSPPGLLFALQGKEPPGHLMFRLETLLHRLSSILADASLVEMRRMLADLPRTLCFWEELEWVERVRVEMRLLAERMLSPESKERRTLWLQFWPECLAPERTKHLQYLNWGCNYRVFTAISEFR